MPRSQPRRWRPFAFAPTVPRCVAPPPIRKKWDPQTRETADHSIPFLVATAVEDGAVTPDSFVSERIRSPALHQLMAKITIEEDLEFTERFPEELNCRMEITDTSGQRFTAETAYPKGHRHNPLKDEE